MIYTRRELRETIQLEKKMYYCHKPYNGFYFLDRILREPYTVIWKFQRILRKTEYFYNNKNNIVCLLFYIIYGRKHNKLGERLGFDIPINVFAEGLIIDHYGCIVINGRCRIGKGCRLHGNNCIGNKGKGRESEVPQIGDNLDMGVGASILGNVKIADNVSVGANAVVTKDIHDACTVVGTPARMLR